MRPEFMRVVRYGGSVRIESLEELEFVQSRYRLGLRAGGLCSPQPDLIRSSLSFGPEAPLETTDLATWLSARTAGPCGPLLGVEKTFLFDLVRSPMRLEVFLDGGLPASAPVPAPEPAPVPEPAPKGPVWCIGYETGGATGSRETGVDTTLESGEVVRIRRGSDDLEPTFSYRGPGPRHRTKEKVTAWIPASSAPEAAEVFGRLLRLHRTLLEVV